MTIVTWITDSLELQPIFQHAVAQLNAELILIRDRESFSVEPMDTVIWSPTDLDQSWYEQIRSRAKRMIICIPRGVIVPRWYPRYDPRWPSLWAITPFAADEFAEILEYLLQHEPLSNDPF